MVQEFKNLTETSIAYIKNNESVKKEIKYTDNTLSNGAMKSYKNDKLVEEIIFENSMPKLQKMYYDNGNLAVEIPMKNGEVNGEAKNYYENGKLERTGNYKNGLLEGEAVFYLEGGQIGEKASFLNGKEEGDHLYYDKTGKLIKKEVYSNGNLLSTEEFQKVEEDNDEGN